MRVGAELHLAISLERPVQNDRAASLAVTWKLYRERRLKPEVARNFRNLAAAEPAAQEPPIHQRIEGRTDFSRQNPGSVERH
jgi:hypothetical protein